MAAKIPNPQPAGRNPALCVRSLANGAQAEFLITVSWEKGTEQAAFRDLRNALRTANAQVIHQNFYACPDSQAAFEKICGVPDWPVTWVIPIGAQPQKRFGTQLQALRGAQLRRITSAGRVLGTFFEDSGRCCCWLGGLVSDRHKPRPAQARQVFEEMASGLRQAQLDFSHVARTWFYLDGILEWYGEFNAQRAAFFREVGLAHELLPASTGCGGPNQAGAALLGGAFAFV